MFNIFKVSSELDKIRLDNLLVHLEVVDTRNKASALIMAGYVFINDKEISKSGFITRAGSVLKIKKRKTWVSRGGIKLEQALKDFDLKVDNLDCLDIGCSTGGFSQVLLARGAKSVLGIDVGYGQLDYKLRNNKRFRLFERTNARFLKLNEKENFDIITADLSFISLKKVIPQNLIYLKKNGILLVLIKPQFEADKQLVGKGGIIKNSEIQKRICDNIVAFFEYNQNLEYLSLIESCILGQKGNKEFFAIFRK